MDNVTPEARGKGGKQSKEMPKIKMNGLDDPDCFVVDGAIIKCDRMSNSVNEQHAQATEFYVPYGTYLEEEYPGQLQRGIRRLSAVQAEGQTDNGIRFATVTDCVCQRDVDEGKAEKASIISMGHCGLYEEQDKEIISENWEKAQEHGTCYCLMSLVSEWTNSRARENKLVRPGEDYSPCRNTMRFYTNEGPVERLTKGATLLCTRGGKITLVTSGQKRFFVPNIILDPAMWGKEQNGMDEDMTLDAARGMMTQYLRGELDEDTLNGIIPWVADNCGLTVNDMKEGDFGPDENGGGEPYERSKQFDDQILAWTYYWNCKIQEEYVYDFQIDPNIVKAMIAQESSFGQNEYNLEKNPSRNVMQSLATGNPTVWLAAGIHPFAEGMFSTTDTISYKMLNETIKRNGALPSDTLGQFTDTMFQQEREKMHFSDIHIISNIFSIDDLTGKYMVVFENVTTNMSISVGIGNLAYKIDNVGKGNISEGVMAYHSQGDEEYLKLINKYLKEMGCEELK